jgi:hypothetical protein
MIPLARFLHVVSMATWLGASLWLAGDARRSLSGGAAEALAFAGRARAAVRLDRVAGLLTILTGVAMIALTQDFPHLRHPLWAGMVLAVVRLGLTDAVLAPTARLIGAGVAAGATPESLQPLARRLAAASGAGHLAWLLALAGMLLPGS